ncbi:MAG: radical SAM protein [Candidatus Pacearchaeota archaeon]|jgi:radical SAM protein with 4Fe4S-binding SPASM domain
MTKLIYEEYFGGELKNSENPSLNKLISRWQYNLIERLKESPKILPPPHSLESKTFSVNYSPLIQEDEGTLNLNLQAPSFNLISEFRDVLLKEQYLDEQGNPNFDKEFKIRKKIFTPKLSGPRGAFLELTPLCLLRCITCYNENTRAESKIIMPPEKNIKILEELASFGANSIALTGGETTLAKEWDNIAKHAKSLGMSVRIYTCGVYNNQKSRERVIEKLKEVNPKEIRITYTGLKSTNDNVRITSEGKGTFDDISETVKQMIEAKLPVKINYTLAHENVSEVAQFIDFVQGFGNGIKIPINFGPVRSYGAAEKCRKFLFTSPNAEDFYKTNLLISRIRREQGLDISMTFDCVDPLSEEILNIKKEKVKNTPHAYLHQGCGLGRNGIGIAHDGSVNVCGIMGSNKDLVEHVVKIVEENPEIYRAIGITPQSLRENKFTNVNSSSIEDIWYNSPLLNFFQVFYKKEQCEPCDKYKVQCGGICPGMALKSSGDLRKGDLGCFKHLMKNG